MKTDREVNILRQPVMYFEWGKYCKVTTLLAYCEIQYYHIILHEFNVKISGYHVIKK